MPNWCYTQVNFYSKDRKQLKTMREDFVRIHNGSPTANNDFGAGWMGDYANKYYPQLGHENVACRGTVEDISDEILKQDDFYYFRIYTETAWDAKIGLWYNICKDFYPNVKIAYIAEEGGLGYFVKWDEPGFFLEEYYVDGFIPTKENPDGEGALGCLPKCAYDNEIVDALHDVLPFNFPGKTLHEALEKIDEVFTRTTDDNSHGFYLCIEKYMEIPPSDFSLCG